MRFDLGPISFVWVARHPEIYLPALDPLLAGLGVETLIPRVLPPWDRYVMMEVPAAKFWNIQISSSWFSNRGRVSGSSKTSWAERRYRYAERSVSSKGWSFPVMRSRKRHFLDFQLSSTIISIRAKILTPSPFASTIRSFSTSEPSDVRMMPLSQSMSAISVSGLISTG